LEYRRLGNSGLKVSALSFGSWVTFSNQMDTDLAEQCMTAAYDAGVNFFDNAEVYARGKSEIIMGKVLKKTGWARDTYIVSSKVMWGAAENPTPTQQGLSRKHLVEAAHQAMERMQVDYLDLYYCHRPDPEVPIEEVVRTMTNLINQGKVLYWGTSEWSAQELMEAHSVARQYNLIPPTMEQPSYSMIDREKVEKEFSRLYTQIGLGTTIFSPLASGLLTGKYNNGIPKDSRATLKGYEWLREHIITDANINKAKQLAPIADELGVSMAKMALAWTLKNPNVSSVITGASRASQVEENMKALDVVPMLTDDVMEKIEAVLDNKPS
jgi:voltage-dependent potassium channel beta subunit